MRKTLLMSAALLGAALALPAFAQTGGAAAGSAGNTGANMSATTSPAAPAQGDTNSAAATPNAGTNAGGTGMAAGNGMNNGAMNNGSTNNGAMNNGSMNSAATGSAGMNNGAMNNGSMPGAASGTMGTAAGTTQNEGMENGNGMARRHARTTRHRAMTSHESGMAMNSETGARPGHEPGVGESEPMAHHPANITSSDTRSVIAPRLPAPPVGQNASAEEFLHVAHNAIRRGRGGEAQEALERAETALLNNPSDPQRAGQVDNGPRVDRIRAALDDLSRRDLRSAERNIAMAEQGGGGGAYGMGGGGMGGSAGMSAAQDNITPATPGTGGYAGAPAMGGATGPSQYYPSGVGTNRGNSFGPGAVNGSELPNGRNSPANGPGSNSGGGGAH